MKEKKENREEMETGKEDNEVKQERGGKQTNEINHKIRKRASIRIIMGSHHMPQSQK